jgi:excisionase family DNA binding protein
MTLQNHGNKLVERMMTANEVADILHVHPSTVRRWQKSGELKSYRLGFKGTLRFKNEDLLNFIETSSSGQAMSGAKGLQVSK